MQQKPGLLVVHTEAKGRAVITTEAISSGDLIEVCHVIILAPEELPIIHKTSLHDYYFLWGINQDRPAIALGQGSLYNHSYQPNAEFLYDYQNDTIDIKAISDISPGEEITVNYHAGDDDGKQSLWFDVEK